MTRHEMIELLGWRYQDMTAAQQDTLSRVERIVEIAVLREREACAKACEDQRDLRKVDDLHERSDRAHKWGSIDTALRTSRELADVLLFNSGLNKAAAAIRARGTA